MDWKLKIGGQILLQRKRPFQVPEFKTTPAFQNVVWMHVVLIRCETQRNNTNILRSTILPTVWKKYSTRYEWRWFWIFNGFARISSGKQLLRSFAIGAKGRNNFTVVFKRRGLEGVLGVKWSGDGNVFGPMTLLEMPNSLKNLKRWFLRLDWILMGQEFFFVNKDLNPSKFWRHSY